MVIVDRTPAELRTKWSADGMYDDLDLYRAFAERVGERPEQDAIVDELGSISYQQPLVLADRFAHLLDREEVGPGDIVAVQLPNRREGCAFDYTIAAVGAINLPIPINTASRSCATCSPVPGSAPISPSTSSTVTTSSNPSPRSATISRTCARCSPSAAAPPGMGSADDALADDRPATWRPRAVDPNRPVRISVTSGTEASPSW